MRLPLRHLVQSEEAARGSVFARLSESLGGVRQGVEASTAEDPLTDRNGFLGDFEAGGKAWFWATDTQGQLVYLSPSFARSSGLESEMIPSVALSDLILHDDGSATIDTGSTGRTLSFHFNGRTGFADVAVRSAQDPEVWWSLSGRPLLDAQGFFAGFRGYALDLTGSRRADAEIARLAHYDALTGLPNRVLMRRTLQGLLASEAKLKGQGDCGLFMLDLDRFKTVNDTLGHPVGDALLEQVAQRLSRVIGDKGCVCRLGGDEFTVVSPMCRAAMNWRSSPMPRSSGCRFPIRSAPRRCRSGHRSASPSRRSTATAPTNCFATPTSRFTPQRTPGAASTAFTNHRCTATPTSGA